MIRCPFHNDDTPSMIVSDKENNIRYYCFGCGAKGDSINFWSGLSGNSYDESVKILSERYNIQALSTLEDLLDTWYENLIKTPGILEKAIKLEFTANGIKLFKIGFCSEECTVNDKFRRFRNRIMIPLRNAYGSLVGFIGRSIDNTEPKYLLPINSEEFNRGEYLFDTYYYVKTILKEFRKVIFLTEGVKDSIALACLGFRSISTLSARFTSAQVNKIISNYLENKYKLYIVYDNDEAGINAKNDLILALKQYLWNIYICTTYPWKDVSEGCTKDNLTFVNRIIFKARLAKLEFNKNSSLKSIEKNNKDLYKVVGESWLKFLIGLYKNYFLTDKWSRYFALVGVEIYTLDVTPIPIIPDNKTILLMRIALLGMRLNILSSTSILPKYKFKISKNIGFLWRSFINLKNNDKSSKNKRVLL